MDAARTAAESHPGTANHDAAKHDPAKHDPAKHDPAKHDPAKQDMAAATLSERDRAVLDFERQWWQYAGSKEQAIKDLFDMSATRYYQVLNGLLDRQDALAYDPMLVKRLRRMRSSRQRSRSARRLGFEI